MTLPPLKGLKLTNSWNFVISQRVFTLLILFLAGRNCSVKKGRRDDATAKFRQTKSRRSCIVRAATLAPFLVRFMTQSDTMAHGTDHKTWETTLSPSGSGTVPARNHHVRSFIPLFFFYFFPALCHRSRSWKRSRNYYAAANSPVELIIPRFNSRR